MRLPFFGKQETRFGAPPPAAATIPPDATVILMVDDEPAQRQLFAFALRREGYWVLEARNGAEALDIAAQAGRIDLVVSDIVMPVMKGPEMAEQLRQQFPDLSVLFVSGYLLGDDLGPNAHVMQKPFVRKDLLKHVYDMVGPPKQPNVA